MSARRIWIGVLAIVTVALLLASCGGGYGGGYGGDEQSASQVDRTEQAGEVEQEARVQVIRDRASLGDPDAPVVIEEYSDFL